MMNRVTDFTGHFKEWKEISRKDIYDYLHSQGVGIDNTIRILIYNWTKRGVLNQIGKGLYKLNTENKQQFSVETDVIQQHIADLFSAEYPDISYCIWNTSCLNSLMLHQHFNQFYIIETENDVLERTFYLLKDHYANMFNLSKDEYTNVYLLPDDNMMDKYVLDTQGVLIIKRLITRAPLVKAKGIARPSIEKILVDIFADKNTFSFIQGAELANIFNNAFNTYVVNMTRLLNYADRRKVRENIKSFVRANVNNSETLSLL